MNREEALQLVNSKLENQNLIKHMIAVGAVMRSLAMKLDQSQDDWELAGLLHDADYEETKEDMPKQGILIADELREKGVSEEICHAIMAHNPETGASRDSPMDKAIYATDPLTGLIIASTLVLPTKKLVDVTTENVLNRFKEKSFAKGARRDAIASCEEINLSLEEFCDTGLRAMQGISDDLGL